MIFKEAQQIIKLNLNCLLIGYFISAVAAWQCIFSYCLFGKDCELLYLFSSMLHFFLFSLVNCKLISQIKLTF